MRSTYLKLDSKAIKILIQFIFLNTNIDKYGKMVIGWESDILVCIVKIKVVQIGEWHS